MSGLIKLSEVEELKGVEPSKAQQIKETFLPMSEMLESFEEKYSKVINEFKEGASKEVISKAKRLRLDIAKVRIQTGKIKDEEKAEYRRAANAIQGVHNIIVWAVKEKEDALKEIEQYYEIQEQKRLEKLQKDRAERLQPYVDDAFERDLKKFEDDEFEALLAMKKKEYEDLIAAQKKAEEERIAKEKAEAERRKRYEERSEILKPYWATLRAEYANVSYTDMSESEWEKMLSDAKKDKADFEEEQRAQKEENERLRKEAEEREAKRKAEEKARKEKERKEKEEYEAKLQAEREEKERIERELQAKKEEELRKQREEEEKRQSELSKGDADKVKDLLKDLESIKTKYTFKSKKNQKMYSDVRVLVDKIINHIKG